MESPFLLAVWESRLCVVGLLSDAARRSRDEPPGWIGPACGVPAGAGDGIVSLLQGRLGLGPLLCALVAMLEPGLLRIVAARARIAVGRPMNDVAVANDLAVIRLIGERVKPVHP